MITHVCEYINADSGCSNIFNLLSASYALDILFWNETLNGLGNDLVSSSILCGVEAS